MGKIFNLGNFLSLLTIGYIGNTIYTLSHFWRYTSCDSELETCWKPLKHKNYKLEIRASPFPYKTSQMNKINQISPILVKTFDITEKFEEDVTFELDESTKNNGSLFFYINSWPSVPATLYKKSQVESFTIFPVSEFRVPIREKNLVDDNKNVEKVYSSDGEKPTAHLRSIFALTGVFLDDFPNLDVGNWPPALRNVKFLRSRSSNSERIFVPPVEIDQMMIRYEHGRELLPINQTTTIQIVYTPRSTGTFRFYKNMALNFENMKDQFGFQDKDIDELKGLLSDTSISMLLLTFFVSTFHLLFDILAFKEDISHWKNRDTFVGISTRSVIWRAFSTIIITMHLYSENSSYLVLGPMAVSCFIESWKVTKTLHFDFTKIKFWQSDVSSAVEEKEKATAEYDAESIKYLSYLLWPLCIGGACYSLYFMEHQSWLHWVLSSVVNGVYAFGFVFMLPQLFINYKLKSVAHLPWKAFMYKAFNTFIDDVFAFLIKMPTSHRLACFRDDIVFFCYLYQRWLYPVDKSRVNEYGTTGEDDVDKEEVKKLKDQEDSDEIEESKKDK